MATLNDYKLVNHISRNYFDRLNISIDNIDDNQKNRLGFYLFILSCITELTDIEELKELIIDTEFRKYIFGKSNNDLGVDAYFIDDDKKEIKLFNFKFRTKEFNPDAEQEINMVNDSSKFINAVYTENIENIDGVTKEVISKIIEKQNSMEIWNTTLYLVSNENKKVNVERNEVTSFEKQYELNIVPVSLDDIIEFVSERPDNKQASFVIDSDSVLTYKDSNLSSSQSYLVKLSLINFIRITCQSDSIRQNYSIEDYKILEEQKLDVSLLYDNVRGYLGETKFNKNILKTLDENPNRFFMFNNGITITTKDIQAEPINGGKKFKCTLNGFQIVNGGQTLRTIYKFKDNNFDEEKLANAEVLVRIFQTSEDDELTNDIAEYTNSQNAISAIDLKSISNIQIKIEEYFKSRDIDYIRKIDKSINKSSRSITMETMAQIIYSTKGFPERVTSQKNALFTKYYSDIFHECLEFDQLIELFEVYSCIVTEYNKSQYEATKQKQLYIIWLVVQYKLEIKDAIEAFENALVGYKTEESISDARKVIQKGFKEYLADSLMKSSISKIPKLTNHISKYDFKAKPQESVIEYYTRIFEYLKAEIPNLDTRLKGKAGRLSWSPKVTWKQTILITIGNKKQATLNVGVDKIQAVDYIDEVLSELDIEVE